MTATRKLWVFLIGLLLASFTVLLWVGGEIHRVMPPIPKAVLSENGAVLYTRADIEQGRQVWQSIGGHQLGSIWGHGSYVAPDWSADWLHREAIEWLNITARSQTAHEYAELPADQQAGLRAQLQATIRTNTYDPKSDTITLTSERATAIATVASHYEALFGSDPKLLELRKAYAMKQGTVDTAEHRQALTAFIWWSAWSAVTERPGKHISYTNNWPHEPLVGNTPPPQLLMWTVFSVLFLIAGIALLGWHHARHKDEPIELPKSDPLALVRVTPSMKATAKYFWLVIALFLTQILLGAITAHYQVEGQEAYGFALSNYLPYSLSRTWHTQLAVLWIATAWLGMGLYIGPAISGHEPKFQRLGVNVLFTCLLIIVVGAFTGQWLAVMQKLGLAKNFWFGHQGWEYVDLGRFWQIFLFAGLGIWLTLVGRALWPAIKAGGESKSITCAAVRIHDLHRPVLRRGPHVERAHAHLHGGVLALVGGAPVGGRLLRSVRHRGHRLPVHAAWAAARDAPRLSPCCSRPSCSCPAACSARCITCTSRERRPRSSRSGRASPRSRWCRWRSSASRPTTPSSSAAQRRGCSVIAGRSCSSPRSRSGTWWARDCSASSSIRRCRSTTCRDSTSRPLHGHTALFGVYGFLGHRADAVLPAGHEAAPCSGTSARSTRRSGRFNIGLAGMALLTLLPIGIIQLGAAIEHGYWYARSAELMQTPLIQTLVWMRVPGDMIFSLGALSIAWFVLRLWVAPKRATEELPKGSESAKV